MKFMKLSMLQIFLMSKLFLNIFRFFNNSVFLKFSVLILQFILQFHGIFAAVSGVFFVAVAVTVFFHFRSSAEDEVRKVALCLLPRV